MEIKEKVIIRHSFHFTEEDAKLIESVLQDVWSFASIHRLLTNYDKSFATVLMTLHRVRESALYNKDLTNDDDEYLGALIDAFCTFEVQHEEDERVDRINDIWDAITSVRRPSRDY